MSLSAEPMALRRSGVAAGEDAVGAVLEAVVAVEIAIEEVKEYPATQALDPELEAPP